jgi:site-specific DNA-methyltransferase (adenine-specific)
MSIRVIHDDMLAALPALAAEGVLFDSVVCDPPYHLTNRTLDVKWCADCSRVLGGSDGKPAACPKCGGRLEYQRSEGKRGFMGKQWDGGDVAFRAETWRAVWDVMKPGAHLIAFSGSRTYHRMACAIEDAGFEIREQIMWLYGSGFPKSHNAGDGWGTALKPAHEPIVLARKPLIGTGVANVLAHGAGALNIDASRIEVEPGVFLGLLGAGEVGRAAAVAAACAEASGATKAAARATAMAAVRG